jgi:hypothetical protein
MKNLSLFAILLSALFFSALSQAGTLFRDEMVRYAKNYDNISNGFHPAENTKRIHDAIAILENQAHVCDQDLIHPSEDHDLLVLDASTCRRLWDADTAVLSATIQSAAKADSAKIAGIIVDKGVAVKLSRVQQAADTELFTQVEKLGSEIADAFRKLGT